MKISNIAIIVFLAMSFFGNAYALRAPEVASKNCKIKIGNGENAPAAVKTVMLIHKQAMIKELAKLKDSNLCPEDLFKIILNKDIMLRENNNYEAVSDKKLADALERDLQYQNGLDVKFLAKIANKINALRFVDPFYLKILKSKDISVPEKSTAILAAERVRAMGIKVGLKARDFRSVARLAIDAKNVKAGKNGELPSANDVTGELQSWLKGNNNSMQLTQMESKITKKIAKIMAEQIMPIVTKISDLKKSPLDAPRKNSLSGTK